MAGITRQIIGSFEDIGKDIVRETANIPKDVVGKVLESMGTTGGKKQQGQQTPQGQPGAENTVKPTTPLDEVEKAKDQKTKQAIARAALQYLAKKPGEQEPGVREKQEKEEKEKQLLAKKQQEEAEKMKLKQQTYKLRRGDLRGMAKKQSGSETSRNVRQD